MLYQSYKDHERLDIFAAKQSCDVVKDESFAVYVENFRGAERLTISSEEAGSLFFSNMCGPRACRPDLMGAFPVKLNAYPR